MPAAVRRMVHMLLNAGHCVQHDDKLYEQACYNHLLKLFKVDL